jgi:hypothetical protein
MSDDEKTQISFFFNSWQGKKLEPKTADMKTFKV